MTASVPDSINLDPPADCPDPALYGTIAAKLLRQHFDTAELAAQCRDDWRQTRLVPEPFASNLDAADHYRSALLALNTGAQRWVAFEADLNRAFADHEDDGDRKDPAIPGWSPGWIGLD